MMDGDDAGAGVQPVEAGEISQASVRVCLKFFFFFITLKPRVE